MENQPKEPLYWIKENVNLFIDQNISMLLKGEVEKALKKRGYKNIYDVIKLGYVGANDGKLLKIIKKNKMVLITFDIRFNKMARKYNNSLSILFNQVDKYSSNTIAKKIELWLIHNNKLLRRIYEADK